jgi:UDP-2,3-diacylglucosamine pyrophosphatase LpxH
MKKYRSIFLSDVHLGSKISHSDMLCDFLKNNSCDKLYIVGDFIDFWKLKRGFYWPQSHSNVIRRVLTASKRGTEVKYRMNSHKMSWQTVSETFFESLVEK